MLAEYFELNVELKVEPKVEESLLQKKGLTIARTSHSVNHTQTNSGSSIQILKPQFRREVLIRLVPRSSRQ